MDAPAVVTEVEGRVARVWLDRPDKLNAVDFDVIEGLIEAAGALATRRDIGAVVLAGRGRSFSAGLDFASVRSNPRRVAAAFLPRPWRGTNQFQQMVWAWRRLPMPVVAVVRGHAFGAGCQLALGADFRLTTPDAQWSLMEARWGLVPDMGGTIPLVELVGLDLAKRLAMTGEVFSGEEAAAWGLASGVTDDPAAAAEELVTQLLQRSPDAVASTKRLLNDASRHRVRAQLALERRIQWPLRGAANTKIMAAASRAKQVPVFGPRRRG